MPRPTVPVLLLLAASGPAAAQTAVVDRPLLPAFSLAGEDGAANLWQNPASLAFDTDSGYALLYRQELLTGAPAAFAAAANTGALATGLQYTTAADGTAWWTLSSGLGLRLDRDLALGVQLGWQLPSGPDNNLVSWDIGAGYRPLPWLGLAAVVQNVGDPAPARGIEQRYTAGAVLRPLDGRLMFGVDYTVTGAEGSAPGGVATAKLRASPVRGLTLRASGATNGEIGAGLEVNMGGPRLGAHGLSALEGGTPTALAYLVSGSEDERLFGGRSTVAHFVLEEDFPYQPADGFLIAEGESYLHLLGRLEQAAEDEDIRGVLVHLDDTPFSLAQIEEIRGAIGRARANGRTVVAYLDRATSNGAYMLAAAAERVYLHPAAQVDLVGLSAEMTFLRGTLDLVGVEPQFARRAEYKSAVESYTSTESSPASREQMDALLDDLYGRLVEGVAAGRARTPEQVRALLDRGPFTAQEALTEGLVDGLLYPDELESALQDAFDEDYELDEDYGLAEDESGWRSPYEIAVIYVDGAIVTGPSAPPGLFGGGRTAGSDTVVAQLDQAREESTVKAVILRVDSPGGSAFASDEIWRAVDRLQREKPVVVSMGGVAASGGYYVSAGATRILATPSTITGSIGVFGGKMSLEGLFDKVGLEVEIYNRGRNAAMYSMSRPFDPVEYAALDRLIADTYRQFKERVGAGRHMDPERVEQVARGRVWSGADAKEQGLVDELGGFHEALLAARELAGISEKVEVDLITYEALVGDDRFVRESVRSVLGDLPRAWLSEEAPPLPAELAELELMRRLASETVFALMPYQIRVR